MKKRNEQKMIYDCETGKTTYEDFTKEELELNDEIQIEARQEAYRDIRSGWLKAFDILKINVAVKIEKALTKKELKWYKDVLDFTKRVKLGIVEGDLPKIPERVKKYNH